VTGFSGFFKEKGKKKSRVHSMTIFKRAHICRMWLGFLRGFFLRKKGKKEKKYNKLAWP